MYPWLFGGDREMKGSTGLSKYPFCASLARLTSISFGVRRGADADRSIRVGLVKMGEGVESENVVVGDSVPSGFGEADFQPKNDENLEVVGEFFLLSGDVDCVDPIELSDTDRGSPSWNATISGACSSPGLAEGERLCALEMVVVSEATRIRSGRPPRIVGALISLS